VVKAYKPIISKYDAQKRKKAKNSFEPRDLTGPEERLLMIPSIKHGEKIIRGETDIIEYVD
jgi:hypothetical protein